MKKIIVLCTSILVIGCNNSSKNQPVSRKIVIKEEIEKWRKDVVGSGVLGNSCEGIKIQTPEAIKWEMENPKNQDGFPKDKNIKSVFKDFDGDKMDDLLMTFDAEACTGHNGGTSTFAKIVFANGNNIDIMNTIKKGIVDEYKKMQEKDKGLKKVNTENFFNESVTLDSINSHVLGRFSLWTDNDAHYAPSYYGSYVYDTKNSSVTIKIAKN